MNRKRGPASTGGEPHFDQLAVLSGQLAVINQLAVWNGQLAT